ncbi:MAG: class I SAM-dependent methyltransferase [Deltaproteobacteria bacterium]|nr:class I SAM-dependent methyltransferase [Deltaproteobacteria bacterium]
MEKPDVEALMQRIRSRVRESAGAPPRATQDLDAKKAQRLDATSPVIFSEDLNYLNSHWHDWHVAGELSTHRRLVGRFILRAKRFILDVVWTYLLKDYVDRERTFQMNLVRFLNATAKYIDARDKNLFWELIQKVDHEISGVNERTDELVNVVDSTQRTIERDLARRIAGSDTKVEQLSAESSRVKGQIEHLDRLIHGLERTLSVLGRAEAPQATGAAVPTPAQIKPFADGIDYLLLENRYRGSEEQIRERQSSYLPIFKGVPGPVLDIGCGRGEFLEVLKSAGIEAHGIDLDESMVERTRQKGLNARVSDALQALTESADRSLGGVFAAQVVEHLKKEQLEELIRLAIRKVKPGGKIVLETINPQSIVALSSNFFRDPTHVWPTHPDTLKYIFELNGVAESEIHYLAPFPPSAMLQPIEITPYLPAHWKLALEALNDNVTRLNGLLFGCQDYCIVGTPRGESA